MENVAHTLIGVVLGEGIARARLKSSGGVGSVEGGGESDSLARARTAILWAAVVGSNLPDADFLLKPFVQGGSLGTLLHHRGYTHTVLLAVPLAFVAATLGRLFAGRRPLEEGYPGGWRGLAPTIYLAAFVGLLGHMTADSWNDYGVHPFWPFWSHWIYGDTIFIAEPLFWLSLFPFVFFIARRQWSRVLCVLAGIASLGLAWSGRFMAWPVALGMTAWGGAWVLIQSRLRSAVAAFAAILIVLGIFGLAGQQIRQRVLSLIPPGEHLLQLSSTPAPSNPLCWRVILTTRKDHPEGLPPTDYTARVGVEVLHPFGLGSFGGFGATDPHRCSPRAFGAPGENSALGFAVETPSLLQSELTWAGEFRGNVAELSEALKTHCRVRSLLRFVRIPFWLMSPVRSTGAIGAESVMVAGDLRYHWGQGLGFADIESKSGEPCYDHEPSWEFPSGLFSTEN